MVSYLVKLAALAAAFPAVFAAPTAPSHLKIRNPYAKDVIEGSFIVVYKNDVNATFRASHIAEISAQLETKRFNGGVGAEYDMSLLKGFQLTAPDEFVSELANTPEIDFIEKDQMMYASALTTQTGAPWGLGRISHRNQDSTSYIYDTTAGSGSTVFVIDTGIYVAHSQFGGRARFGANFVDSSNTDGNGHGTHCAGTIAGSTYGVAKKANVVAVKVLGATGSGSNSGVISGIQWATTNRTPRSVISMSLGGGYSAATNNAVRAAVSAGVTVVVAAGNENQNAANVSPASEPSVITVGAIDQNDVRATFSNFGSVLDIFAPGVGILSSWIGGTTATRSISGTSMACPHVAGLAAYLMGLEGITTPSAVTSRIIALATTGKVVSGGSGSPNRISYNGNGA